MTVVTQDELTALVDEGAFLGVISTSFQPKERPEWNILDSVREFVQNSLDETEEVKLEIEAPVPHPFSRKKAPCLHISDEGGGFGVKQIFFGSGEKFGKFLRGRFGEGMKIACIVALREGYDVRIDTVGMTIFPVLVKEILPQPRPDGTVVEEEVITLKFPYTSSKREKGTVVTIYGYKPVLKKIRRRFVPFLLEDEPEALIAKVNYKEKYFESEGATLTEDRYGHILKLYPPKKVLYVRDIYVGEMKELFNRTSIFSYNAWDITLTRERNRPADMWEAQRDIIWLLATAGLEVKEVREEVFKRLVKISSPDEGLLEWVDAYIGSSETWVKAFEKKFGKNVCRYTDAKISKYVEHVGYKVLFMPSWLANLAGIKADKEVASEHGKKQKKEIPDEELSEEELSRLEFLRELKDVLLRLYGEAKEISRVYPLEKREVSPVEIKAAEFEADPVTGQTPVGIWLKEKIYISRDKLREGLISSMNVFVHEFAHHVSESPDLTEQHSKALSEVGTLAAVAMFLSSSLRNTITELIGAEETPGPDTVPEEPPTPPPEVPDKFAGLLEAFLSGAEGYGIRPIPPEEVGKKPSVVIQLYKGPHLLKWWTFSYENERFLKSYYRRDLWGFFWKYRKNFPLYYAVVATFGPGHSHGLAWVSHRNASMLAEVPCNETIGPYIEAPLAVTVREMGIQPGEEHTTLFVAKADGVWHKPPWKGWLWYVKELSWSSAPQYWEEEVGYEVLQGLVDEVYYITYEKEAPWDKANPFALPGTLYRLSKSTGKMVIDPKDEVAYHIVGILFPKQNVLLRTGQRGEHNLTIRIETPLLLEGEFRKIEFSASLEVETLPRSKEGLVKLFEDALEDVVNALFLPFTFLSIRYEGSLGKVEASTVGFSPSWVLLPGLLSKTD